MKDRKKMKFLEEEVEVSRMSLTSTSSTPVQPQRWIDRELRL
jgi:hypothetical protein